jgi:hypothetical protein
MIATLWYHVQSLPIMQAVNGTIRTAPFKLTYGFHPQTPKGEVVEIVNPASAAFVERLQSSRKCLIAAQQRQKVFADKGRVEKTYKVSDKVLHVAYKVPYSKA